MAKEDKPVNDKAYTLRLPSELYRKAAQKALDEDRRINEVIVEILQQAIGNYQPRK